jgi:hypothetical protein
MFLIKNVPIVIEPGVRALEAEFVVNDKIAGKRLVPVRLFRVALDEVEVQKLPFIPTTRFPHVFSITSDVDKSGALVVYDSAGRISALYTKDASQKSWDRFDIAEEHAGKSITQFSVRFVFNTARDRSKFLAAMEKITAQVAHEEQPNIEDVMEALRPLARTRVAPVIIPVAAEKSSMGKIKL